MARPLSGPLPIVSKGTHIIVQLVDELEDDRWEAKIVEQNGNTVKLSVNSTPKAVVGVYALSVTTCSAKGNNVTVHEAGKKVVMLFNPWCEGNASSPSPVTPTCETVAKPFVVDILASSPQNQFQTNSFCSPNSCF